MKRTWAGREKLCASALALLVAVSLFLIAPSPPEQIDVVPSSESSRNPKPHTASIITPRANTNNKHIAVRSTNTDGSIDVCFISSIYGKNKGGADKPGDFSQFQLTNGTSVGFFMYTNLADLDAPGWIKIIKRFEYRRFITQSRWGKFMAWQDPEIQPCKAVFYFDGHYQPQTNNPKAFVDTAVKLQTSHVGLAQVNHPAAGRTPLQEFETILKLNKDIQKNVDKSVQWFKAQPDFHNNCTMYANFYFGYDPLNPRFREATQYFWDHYSKEEDSWRDQPLWCYTLAHLGVQPLELSKLFSRNLKRMGHKGHTYSNATDNDAAQKR